MTPACHAGWTCGTCSFVGSETSHLSRRPVFFKKRWNPRLFPALYRRRQSSPKANKSALDLPFLASVGLVGDGRLGEVRYDLWPRPALRLFWFVVCGLWRWRENLEFGVGVVLDELPEGMRKEQKLVYALAYHTVWPYA